MARFGQGMINSLINPSYAQGMNQVGLMAGSLPGRMREAEAEREKLRRQQAAQTSMFSLLNQADPNDPNTMNAVTQMGAAYGLDPKETQAALLKSQTAAQQRERMEIARDTAVYAKAAHELAQEKAAQAKAQQSAVQVVEGAIARDPKSLDKALENISPEHRAFARDYAKKYQDYQAEVQKRREDQAANAPITEDDLKYYETIVGPETINIYKTNMKYDKGAAGKLRELVNKTQGEKIKAEAARDAVEKGDATEKQVEEARALVNKEFGRMKGFRTLDGSERTILARAVASKRKNDNSWAATPENMRKLAEEMLGDVPEDSALGAPLKEFWGNITSLFGGEKVGQDEWYTELPPETQAKVDQARAAGYSEEEIREAL